MKAKKAAKKTDNYSFDEAMEIICNTPKEQVVEAMKKEKEARKKKRTSNTGKKQ